MFEVRGAQFPDPRTWIVAHNQLDTIGQALLDVTAGALELYGFGERYERMYVGHGTTAVLEPSRANQLVVVLAKVHIGRPGEEVFQVVKGNLGEAGYRTGHYLIEIATPWPTRQGEAPVKTTDIDEHRQVLWRDGLIVWEAVRALSLGGVSHPDLTHQNEIALGPLTPSGPKGGIAAWVAEAQVLL